MAITVETQQKTIITVVVLFGLLVNVFLYFGTKEGHPHLHSKPYTIPKKQTKYFHRFSDGNHFAGQAPVAINFTIVLYVVPHWMKYDHSAYISQFCEYRNCRVTTNRTNLRNQSAILFILNSGPGVPTRPPISPSERNPDQAWVFMWYEAPIRHTANFGIYKNIFWRNSANWTASFSDNADIVHPLGTFEKRTPPTRNYSEIFQRKNKTAAWLVSNCKTPSRREDYVKKLRKHGIEVDIYGKCAGNQADENKTLALIDKSYKFYLSFENSLCKDYITEKFYKYYKLDVILIVRGGGNYSRLLPGNAYINTADFSSTAELAAYLNKVASSEQLYTNYLRNKDGYASIREELGRGSIFCGICDKLNNLDDNRKYYTNLLDIIHNGTCNSPNDII